MVKTRQQNANAESISSVTKFTKEQNDLKFKEVQEFAAYHAAGPYPLNLYVLGLNYSSTEAEKKKICFLRHAIKYSCIYLEVLQMAQPHIIL